jgi:arylsulfatase A-like enzyme
MNHNNVLFITCHDLGRHLGCYENETVHTPNLDRLASEGVLFANSFCTGPTCSPSRAALHTGRYAHANGMMGLATLGWKLKSGEKHMAKRLHEAGWDTALVGVQHVAPKPRARGIGYDEVYPQTSGPIMAEAAVRYLRDERRKEQPFYLEVGFVEPHRPYNFGDAQPDPASDTRMPWFLADGPEAQEDIGALQGAIRKLDEGVGLLLTALKEAELERKTWVIFTTDHGLALPGAKGSLYDPGIETALLMRWPDAGIAGGRIFEPLVSNVDVVPTMLEALGMDVPGELQGVSQWPLLQGDSEEGGKAGEEREHIFAEKNFHLIYDPNRCIRTKTHKLIVNFEHGPHLDVPGEIRRQSPVYSAMIQEVYRNRQAVELYDLRRDPLEQHNLAGQEEKLSLERQLCAHLYRWMQDTRDPLLEGPIVSPHYTNMIGTLRSI